MGNIVMKTAAWTAVAAIIVVANGTAAIAQNRTFVSGQGTDSGTCTLQAPCRSLAYAVTQTEVGGELAVLNTAGYGAATIMRAISITNEDGVEAAVSVTSGDGITINAPGSVVNLRGLTLTGTGGGKNGMTLQAAATLNIQNCVVRGFSLEGLNFTTGALNVSVFDTTISNNGNNGIYFGPVSNASLYLENVRVIGNGNTGIEVDGSFGASTTAIHSTVKNSVADGNGDGIFVEAADQAALPTMLVVNSSAVNNSNAGLGAQNATMTISQTAVSGNKAGYAVYTGGTIRTYSNNFITDTTNQGTLTPFATQ